MIAVISLVLLLAQSPGSLLEQARAAWKQSRPDEAEQLFRKSIQLDPQQLEAYIGLGQLYRSAGRLEPAESILLRARQLFPRDPTLFFHLGIVYADQRKFEEALSLLKSISPDQAPAGYAEAVARISLSAGRLEDAEQIYRQLLEKKPGSISVLRALSGIALKKGDAASAWEYMAEARRQAPNSPEILYQFAQVSLSYNLVLEAIHALRLLLLLEPDHSDYLLALGGALVRSTDYREAPAHFSRYLELQPGDAQGEMALGYSLYLANDLKGARQHLEKALEIDPKLVEAQYYLGMLAYKEGGDGAAEELFRKVLAKQEHAEASLALGKLFLRRGQYREAAAELEKTAALIPNSSDLHFQLSRLYAQLGDRERAQKEQQLYQQYKKEEAERDDRTRELPFTHGSSQISADPRR